MKISNPVFSSPLQWNDTQVGVIVLERPSVFAKFVADISRCADREDAESVVSLDGKELKKANDIIVIRDPLAVDVNEKRILSAVMSQICGLANGEFAVSVREISAEFQRVFYEISSKLDYPAYLPDDLSWERLLRGAGVFLDAGSSMLERLVCYIRAAGDVLHCKLIVLVGVKAYLEQNELLEVYANAAAAGVSLCFVEASQYGLIGPEQVIVLDNDLCELHFSKTNKEPGK